MRLQTIIWREGKIYIIKEAVNGVTTQGKTIDEAMANMKKAVSLYLEEKSETRG